VLAVTLLHNVEELVTVRAALSRPPMAPLLGRWGVSPQRAWAAFRTLNWAVSGAAAAAVIVGIRRREPALPGVLAATMLVNVLVTHVPAALRARGYAPGLVTAVTLVLPRQGGIYCSRIGRDCCLNASGDAACRPDSASSFLGVPGGLIAADRLAGAVGTGVDSAQTAKADTKRSLNAAAQPGDREAATHPGNSAGPAQGNPHEVRAYPPL